MTVRRPMILVASITLLFTVEVFAQTAVESPHGPLRDTCETCHTAEGWSVRPDESAFRHATTGFDLDGAHGSLECTDCHLDLEFASAEATCASCHIDVHRGELGDDCVFCHTTRSFLDQAAIRRMHRETRFALTGRHAGVDCESCHVPQAEGGLTYLGVTTECFDCHRSEYETVASPDHVTGGFAQQCEFCHGTAAWAGGFFNHERQFGGGPLVCVQCHQDDYDGAIRPDHATAGFPLQCEACHNTRSWYGDDFPHDDLWFPIYTGAHSGEWDDCTECHDVPQSFQVFDCLGCHPHSDRSKTDGDHDGDLEGGREYSYDSVSCYSCHPRGRS